MRFEFIEAEKANFPVTTLCRVLEVSCSGFYRWLSAQPSEQQTNNDRLKLEIKSIHTESRGTAAHAFTPSCARVASRSA